MTSSVFIRDLFKLDNGITVFACDRVAGVGRWPQNRYQIVSRGGDIRQELTIQGERKMARQTAHLDQLAVETFDPVQLSLEEAQSGQWALVSLVNVST